MPRPDQARIIHLILGLFTGRMYEVSCSQQMWKLQGALGKLALVKDKASDGVAKVRKTMGRNKDIQCRVHLKVKGSRNLRTHLVPGSTSHAIPIAR